MTTTKPAAKPAVKTAAAKPATTRRAAPAKRAAAPAKHPVAAPVPPVEPKAERPKKPKLVRDSFTIPKTEYAVIEELKARCLKLGRSMKKSELLRAGLKALAAMNDGQLQKAMAAVTAIKTGRPKA